MIVLSVKFVGADAYIPYSGIESGTDGQIAMELRLHNLGPDEMECTAQLAHWYSTPLGIAASGDTITAEIWRDPIDGTLALLNETDDRMPVEAVWCALADAPLAERTRINLPVRAGNLPTDVPADLIARDCASDATGDLICGPAG